MEGKKYIENLLEDFAKITFPGHAQSVAYQASREAGIDVEVKNLKLSRELTEEETLKFLDFLLPRFAKEIGPHITKRIVKRNLREFKLHFYLGYLTLIFYFTSLLTFNFWLTLGGLFILFLQGLLGYFGVATLPREGIRILEKFCLPLTLLSFIFGCLTAFTFFKKLFELGIIFGILAFLSLALVQWWSGPKVKLTTAKLKALLLAKIERG